MLGHRRYGAAYISNILGGIGAADANYYTQKGPGHLRDQAASYRRLALERLLRPPNTTAVPFRLRSLGKYLLVQELHDLAAGAELFAGDALCFANVACLAAHLPYTLRAIALNRARNAVRKHDVPVSQPCVVGDESRSEPHAPASTPNDDTRPYDIRAGSKPSSATGTLKLERYRVGDFATGVLTNVTQLQSWACATETDLNDDDGGGDDSGDESDGGRGCGGGGGDGLPFHPAFMDAAMLTLSTPKWPLLLDPEGIALRRVELHLSVEYSC